MKEQSHLEEMRAALRGDRERAERRRSTDSVRTLLEPGPEREPEEDTPREPRRGLLRRLLGR